jgi:hypothetical protein
VAVGRPSRMGRFAISLRVLGRALCTFMDDAVIIVVGSEALSSVLYFLVNEKGRRGTGSCRAGHRLSY